MVSGTETAIKVAPPIMMAAISSEVDLLWLIVIPAGLVIGTMAQAGLLVKAGTAHDEFRKQMLASVLVGLANCVLAGVIIWSLGLNYVQGLAAATLCAFGGVGSIETAFAWAYRHLLQDAAARGGRSKGDGDV